MSTLLYVYAIGRQGNLEAPAVDGVGGDREWELVTAGDLCALAGRVDAEEFSQESIDRHAADLDWIGEIGYRHQEVVNRVRETSDVIPLRAFTLFSSPQALRDHLEKQIAALGEVLDRIRGRDEWTLQIGLDGEAWKSAIEKRSSHLSEIAREAAAAPAGRAYLLRKKLEDERKNASREAEQSLLDEIEGRVREELGAPMVTENRQRRGGSFPQIDVLLERDRRDAVLGLREKLQSDYEAEGITISLTGPWPPYTFVSRKQS